MLHYIYSSLIYSIQKLETTQMSLNRRMDAENVLHLCNGTLFSLYGKQTLACTLYKLGNKYWLEARFPSHREVQQTTQFKLCGEVDTAILSNEPLHFGVTRNQRERCYLI